MDHYFDTQQQEGGTPLTLLLGNPQPGEEPITEQALKEELSKMAEIVSLEIVEQSNGTVTKAYVKFSDDFVTGMIKDKLDNSKFGKTSIVVRAMTEPSEPEPSQPTQQSIMNEVKKKNLLPQLRDDFALEAQQSTSRAGQYNFRFLTDDPNLMGQHFNEFRQNNPWNHSNSHVRQRPYGGDSQLIDGPHEYAYNKLLSNHHHQGQQVGTRSQNNFTPQGHNSFQPLRKPIQGIPQQPNQQFGYQNFSPPHRGYNQAEPIHQNGYNRPPPQDYQQHRWSQAGESYSTFSRQGFPAYPEYMVESAYSAQSAPIHHRAYENHFAGNQGQQFHQYEQGRYPALPPRANKVSPKYSPMQQHPQDEFYDDEQPPHTMDHPDAYGGSEYCTGAWDPDQDGELTTSAGSDKKKLVAELKIKSMIDQRLSRVVHVKGLESEDISADVVSSLFANFGNIKQLLFLKKKHTALVEYLDQDSASFAREMLNNLTFFGSQLKVSYSTYMSIEENLKSSNNPEKFREVFTPNPKSYRFKDYKKISINPPSKVLHLSNISKESYTDKAISDIFSRFGQIKRVKLLNGSDEEKCMALIEFASLESALAAISTLHNKIFFSR